MLVMMSAAMSRSLHVLDGIADILDKSGTSHAATDQAQHDMMAKFTQALNS
jgi:hypothetical protein